MSFCRLFPRPLAACFALSLLAVSAQAQQTTATRPRQATTPATTTITGENQGRPRLENDIFVATDEPYGLIKGTITRGG